MDNTTKPVVFFDGRGFFLVTERAKSPLDAVSAMSMKSGYDLVLDDSLLFYTSMEFPQKRKPDAFIQNWLAAGFPAEYTNLYGYIRKGDRLLISLFSPKIAEDRSISKIMEKAGRVASPMSIKYSSEDSFSHSYGTASLRVDDGAVVHVPFEGDISKKTFRVTDASAILLPFSPKKLSGLKSYALPAAVLLICYLLFVTGSYLRLGYHTKRLAAAEQMLQSVYERAGVADSPDPFGLLMFKAQKSSGSETYKNMKIIETLSRAQSDRITAVSVEIKNGQTVYEGISEDYAYIDDFKKQMTRELGRSISITDTRKGDNGISFTARF